MYLPSGNEKRKINPINRIKILFKYYHKKCSSETAKIETKPITIATRPAPFQLHILDDWKNLCHIFLINYRKKSGKLCMSAACVPYILFHSLE